jgi:predicted glycosyltransferase
MESAKSSTSHSPVLVASDSPPVWVDIDNPPQVQYLVPVAREFAARGCRIMLTARDNSITHQLLVDQGVDFLSVGKRFGRQTSRKILGVLGRAWLLMRTVRDFSPRIAVAASRSAAIAARLLNIPCFIICDYEHAELRSYTFLRSYLVSPEIIPSAVFRNKGFAADRLLSIPGLKEDLTFFGQELSVVKAYSVPDPARVVVLLRPPAAETHYYERKSSILYQALLTHLTRLENMHVIFLPRYEWQVEEFTCLPWEGSWEVPEKPIPPIPLLKAADLVVSSGGTMLREACYLNVPAYSIFQSQIGAVDQTLCRTGRLVLLSSPEEFGGLRIVKKQMALTMMRPNQERIMSSLIDQCLQRASAAR